MRDFKCFVFFQPVFSNQPGKKGAINAARHIVPCRNGKKCARVVVEADRIVEARRLGR